MRLVSGAKFTRQAGAPSSRCEDLQRHALEHVLGLAAKIVHVGDDQVRLERLDAFPFLNDRNHIGANFSLSRERGRHIDHGSIFKATLLGESRIATLTEELVALKSGINDRSGLSISAHPL